MSTIPTSLSLSIRRTHGYNDDYSHLDEWADIGTYRVLQSFHTQEPSGNETDEQILLVEVTPDEEEKPTRKEILGALEDSLSKRGCSHEHDCCGCTSIYVSQISRRSGEKHQYYVFQSLSRNF